MNYVSVSFTHKNTDLELREKLSFGDNNKKREILRLIGANETILESMALSTCNRVEIFAFANDVNLAIKHILSSISILTLVPVAALEIRADIYENQSAIHHLFAVASSLDSLAIGETQIVGQLKEAFKFAYENGDCALNIQRAVNFAFKCSAEVRNLTEISKNKISIASVAVAKAAQIYGNIGGMTAVVIGAGAMSELVCRHLISQKVNVIILNRSLENAKNLANKLGNLANYDSFDKIKEYINKHRLIFSATGCATPVITDSLLEFCDFERHFFDIAVPRDILLKENSLIRLYAVDDLDEIVKTNLALREEQASKAYSIVGKFTNSFFKWLLVQNSTPAIKALRGLAREISTTELEKAIKKGYIKNSDKDEAKRLIHQVFKAFLHTPTIRLKENNNPNLIKNLEYLFEIKIENDENLGENDEI